MIALAALPGLLSRYWHFAALGLLTILLGVQTYRVASLKADIAEQRAAVAEEYTKAAVNVILRERASVRIAQEEAERHETTITDLRAAAARRLQGLTGKPGPLPVVPDAAFKPHESAGRDRLCIETAFAVALMLAADENTQTLIGLQGWVRREIEARK